MTTSIEIRHFHLFAGLGGGARGFNQGSARVKNLQARFRCIGGVDNDPAAMRDFQRLAGVPGTVLDMFDREQYAPATLIRKSSHSPGCMRRCPPSQSCQARMVPWIRRAASVCVRPAARRAATISAGKRLPDYFLGVFPYCATAEASCTRQRHIAAAPLSGSPALDSVRPLAQELRHTRR